ncbi:high-affinity branched-chain amino acid transport system permease protein BraD [Thermacetogenium phaeum DSM 12270]|uniref:High-affinity branched-chain amino acid transport system permease protein BraD n=1 Tax=Thermacetogenium phaeum (strain ATCC BAA-254 / DSM 26808 / PB) TaxID=1089553 RepID=K4LHS3_THEPS|nr:branched-chain amino acid ABC transporter permease [Thermacetogenium phaeum]AFV12561.1 high-affinity branched-chain amino acid transport system permease protein BraD [Thermacetogenium phaeum DSM 12270]
MEQVQTFLQLLPQQLINGITLGATYALIALGYTMVYGIIQLINFAHGEVYMIGAFTGLLMVLYYKVNFFIAMLSAILVCVPLAVLIERVAYRPLRGSTRLAPLISALGVSLFLQTLMTLIMGPNAQGFPEIVKDTIYTVATVKFSLVQIVILLVSSILMVALHLTVKFTKVGKAMRATSESYETANLMGINVNRIISFTFAIGAALAGAGGVLVGMYFNSVHPLMGVIVGLKCFCAAVLGGIGSIPGAMLGGIFLGVAEVMGVAVGFGTYRDAIAFALLILVLLVKPTGILGRPIQRKV